MSKAFLDVAESDIAAVGLLWRGEGGFAIERVLLSEPGRLEALKKDALSEGYGAASSKASVAALRGVFSVIDGASGEELIPLLDMSCLNAFKIKVLRTLRDSVPRGRLTSYGALASFCGNPGAARAVGSVMATNPFPIIFPCHRVVGAGGFLGGFGPGLALKLRLLEREGVFAKGTRFGMERYAI